MNVSLYSSLLLQVRTNNQNNENLRKNLKFDHQNQKAISQNQNAHVKETKEFCTVTGYNHR